MEQLKRKQDILYAISTVVSNLREKVLKDGSLAVPDMLKYVKTLTGLLIQAEEWEGENNSKEVIYRKAILALNAFICVFFRGWNSRQRALLRVAVDYELFIAPSDEATRLLDFNKEVWRQFNCCLQKFEGKVDNSIFEAVKKRLEDYCDKMLTV